MGHNSLLHLILFRKCRGTFLYSSHYDPRLKYIYHLPAGEEKMSYYSSSRSSSRATDCKVYVGDLGNGAAKGELERAFSYYGPLRSVWVARNPPGFAFVEFEDPRDAEDAVKGMDGK